MFQGQLFYYHQLIIELDLLPPAQLGTLLGAINVFRLPPPHLIQDGRHPARQLLDPDIVDWVVETSAIAQFTSAPTTR